ncbi:MAG: hypothetical protein IPJ27_16555 [Candidatus Accumulibacter sp.]|uniref:Calcium-binding protein n=1 Tax=Candidatus Accumulibacter proximus TaxID=2954385 RepID=A0A935UI65_9PROT|nr:hypothetical protein [Candidatus Accumulibacter proximus]
MTGTQFMDNLVGGEQADILRGGAGNDVLVGGGGNDTLEGGDGDDGFRAGVNSQQIDGGNGTDWLEIDLSGFAGGLVWANDPTQRVTLANGLTVSGIEVLALTTGAGDDEIRNTLVAAGDTITTGDGNDIIDAGGGNDTVNAGGGDDVIYQKDPGRDTVDGGTGDDLLVLDFSGEGADWYSPGYGIWMDFYDAAGANLSSGVWWKSSVPNGTVTTQLGSRNYGVTFSGIERLDVTGTQFMDNLVGGEQADILRGGAGNDVLVGGGGNDTLEGGDGDDGFRAGVNSQQIDGGNGTDWLEIDLSGFAGGLVWANDPTQRVTLANGLTVSGIEVLALTTGAGDDEIRNTLVAAGDTITTGDGNDIIDAGGGNDTVNAGGGDDVIYQKDPGRDTVDGGTGMICWCWIFLVKGPIGIPPGMVSGWTSMMQREPISAVGSGGSHPCRTGQSRPSLAAATTG